MAVKGLNNMTMSLAENVNNYILKQRPSHQTVGTK